MRHCILLLSVHLSLLCGAFAQAAKSQIDRQIRGVVVEPETSQPIVGAEVSLARREPTPKRVNGGWNENDSMKLTTDVNGAFVFSVKEPGEYRVEASKSGYGQPDSAEIKLTADQPTMTVKLFLKRSGTLTGRVFSSDTGDPLIGLHVRAVRAVNPPWTGFESDGVEGTTGAHGEFTIGVPPGNYAIEIFPQTRREKRVLTEFTEEDLKTTDLEYQQSYWPGGPDSETATPVRVDSGTTLDVGLLPAKKVRYYRVRVRVSADGCEPGNTVQVAEAIGDHGSLMFPPPLAHVACGQDFLLAGHPPGSFRLLLDVDRRNHENAATASAPFTITDKNITIDAPLLPGITVDGVIVPAPGARTPDFAKLTVRMQAMDMPGSPDDGTPVPDGEGKFRICCLRSIAYALVVTGLHPGWYVKEVRYSGIPTDGLVPLDELTTSSGLTIVVDDKVASISGQVMNNNDPVSRPFVIAVKWPMKDVAALEVIGHAEGDSSGRFQMTDLAPGEYHVLAVSSQEELKGLSGPAFHNALADGAKMELGPGASQIATLELSPITQR